MAVDQSSVSNIDWNYPNLLSKETLLRLFKLRGINQPGIETFDKNVLVNVYNHYLLPLPQRKYRPNRRGKEMTKKQIILAKTSTTPSDADIKNAHRIPQRGIKRPRSVSEYNYGTLSNHCIQHPTSTSKSKGKNETDEQRVLRLQQQRERKRELRNSETPEEREERLRRQRVRDEERRNKETDEQREERLIRQRVRDEQRRNEETYEQREERLSKQRVRDEERRNKETDEQREERLTKQRVRDEKRRNKETDEEREERLIKQRVRDEERRNKETNEQRKERLIRQRARDEQRRNEETNEQREERLIRRRARDRERRNVPEPVEKALPRFMSPFTPSTDSSSPLKPLASCINFDRKTIKLNSRTSVSSPDANPSSKTFNNGDKSSPDVCGSNNKTSVEIIKTDKTVPSSSSSSEEDKDTSESIKRSADNDVKDCPEPCKKKKVIPRITWP